MAVLHPDRLHPDSLFGDQVCDVGFRKGPEPLRKWETASVVLGHEGCHRAENDDTRLVRACVPRLRETIYHPYDEYVLSGVAILDNFKS